jgi:hypothetical protein
MRCASAVSIWSRIAAAEDIFALFSLFFMLSSQLRFAQRPVQLVLKSFNFSEKENLSWALAALAK